MRTVKELTRKMKDSGVEWIGEIPEDWEVIRLKNMIGFYSGYAFKENELSGSGDKFVLRIGNIQNNKLSINSDTLKTNLNETTLKNQKVLNEDILIAMSGATVGKIVYIEQTVKRLYINQRVGIIRSPLNHLLKYYFLINGFREYIFLNSQGSAQPNISETEILNYMISLPPKSQQKSIADFLDKKTQEIDNIISKTKKAIEEYKRYKQSLITETVTKGLDENVEMKYSGIEWIGEIPEHWDTIKFKDLFKFGSGLTITKSDLLDEGIKVINYGEIHSKYKFDLDINRDELKCVDKSYLENRKNALINKGDFVFCDTSEDREGSGNCIVLRENNDELIFAGSHTVTARLIRNENPIYIRYMIMASSVKEQISSTVVGIKVYSITQAILKTIIGVLPPLKEQEEIANYLDKKCSQIDNIISTKEKLLTEMEAYKKSLIYETVTGKREVE